MKRTLLILVIVLSVCLKTEGQTFTDQAESMGVAAIVSSQEWGSGSSAFDFNGDGLDDITLCDDSGNIRLYENNGDGFTELNPIFQSLGLMKQFLWVDFDNDGDLDAMMTTLNGKFKLYNNNGDFIFEDITLNAGLPVNNNFYSGIAVADYDRDGDLDVYIGIYTLADSDPDDDIYKNKLYKNNGDGTFTNVTVDAGVQEDPTLTFQPVWTDINNDLYPDLYVINDRQPVNFLFLNNGDGTFENITQEANAEFPGMDCMSNSVSDFNGDGYLDIYMTNSGSANYPNFLLSNNQDNTFTDVAQSYDAQGFQFGWGSTWVDADNDGWDDIFYCTSSGVIGNKLFMNDFGLGFSNASDELEIEDIYPSYSVSKGDFNNDGYGDLVVQNRAPNPPYVMMNQLAGNNYAKVTLEGTVSNKDAIGSWIKVYHNNSAYSKYTFCGQDYYGQSSQHRVFGLGNSSSANIDSISVTYTSGHTDVYYDLPLNEHYYFTEGETYTVNITAENNGEFCTGDSIALSAGAHENYTWSTGETTESITVNSGGTYSINVTNSYGITASNTLQVVENPIPAIVENTTPIFCFGDSTGTIALVNQNDFAPDSVWWNNEMQDAEIDSLPAGVYDYFFQDINGCSTTGSVSLNQPSELIIIANTIPETDGYDGEIFLAIFGGTPPFMIEVEDEEAQSSSITDLPGGAYQITVTDGNGCSKTTTVIVESVVSAGTEDPVAFNIYPNPTADFLYVEAEGYDGLKAQIFDVTGKAIGLETSIQNGYLDLRSLAKGTYIVEIKNSDRPLTFKRFTKL